MPKASILIAISLAAILTSRASGGIVFSDHFTGPTLDPAWNVSFQNATGWSFTTPSASGTHLLVTDILGAPVQGDSGSTYGVVQLSRSFQAVGDFQLDFDFSWNSENQLSAMQYVYLALFDSDHQRVGYVGYFDAWIGFTGGASAHIDGSTSLGTVKGSLPFAGTAAVQFDRVGTDTSVLWNGQEILSGNSTRQVSQVELYFGFFNYTGQFGTSTFGSESVDLISLSSPESAAVPEPASLAIWLSSALGALCLARFKGRRVALATSLIAMSLVANECNAAIITTAVNPTNGHTYHLLSANTWTASEAEAISLGGHLVTINDAAENAWVVAAFGNYQNSPRHLWIGLSDAVHEGQFVWSSGESVTYTNWSPIEPNGGIGENYAHVWSPSVTVFPLGSWNDQSNVLASDFHGVVEIVPPAAAVPEPASIAIWSLASISLAFGAVRRRRCRP